MTDATMLPGPAISYDVLVQVMDTVRVYQLPVAPFSKAELFPDIAIADAPHDIFESTPPQRRHGANHFALIPFIDMMTILVVFLLAHTAEVDILPNTKNIRFPSRLSDRKPSAAVVVMVTKDSVYVDGQAGRLGERSGRNPPGFRSRSKPRWWRRTS
jgi:hypothetical protein